MFRFADYVYVVAWTLGGMLLVDYANGVDFGQGWIMRNMNDHLGAEYDEIAKAIFAGRGFSDPFRTESGPTAWMPPVLPYFLAALYWITDFQPQMVVELVLGFKAAVIVLTGMIILSEARRLDIAWLGYLMFPLTLIANFDEFFLITHDVWLLLLCVNLLWLGLVYYWRAAGVKQAVCWGLFGGFVALCSPAVGAAWALSTSLRSLSIWRAEKNTQPDGSKETGSPHKPSNVFLTLLAAALVSLVVTTPWTLRNRLVFGAWIPIKSNSGYELWQAQCLDDDGVLDRELIFNHPYVSSNGELRRRYLELGERAFLREKSQQAWDCVRADPAGYLRRLGHRSLAALIWYYPFSEPTGEKIWTTHLKRLVFPLAFLSLVLVFVFAKRRSVQFNSAATITLAVLLPYILISYGDRYAAPLVALKCLLIIHATVVLKQLFINMRAFGEPVESPAHQGLISS